jgi:hypothetical protein
MKDQGKSAVWLQEYFTRGITNLLGQTSWRPKGTARSIRSPTTALEKAAPKTGGSILWLHKTVLQKLADNGGNIPKELLD